MATRPVTSALWATDNVNNTAPNLAKRQLGWVNSEEPSSSYFNWWQNLVGQWCDFLADALVDFGAAELRASIGGFDDVNVTSQLTCNQLFATTMLGVTDATACDLELAIKSTYFSAAALGTNTGGGTFTNPYWAGGTTQIALPIPVGHRITNVRFNYQRNGAGTANCRLRTFTGATLNAAIASGAVGATNGTDTNLDVAVSNHTIVAGDQYIAEFAAGNSTDRIYGAIVTYRPIYA